MNQKHIEILQANADNLRAVILNAGDEWIDEMVKENAQAELEAIEYAIHLMRADMATMEVTTKLTKPTP
jgi:hypothetical protein